MKSKNVSIFIAARQGIFEDKIENEVVENRIHLSQEYNN